MSYLTRAIGAVKLFGKANAPTIMVVSGVAAMGAGAIMGANKTLHLEDVIKPHVETLENVEKLRNESPHSYTEKMHNKDRMIVFGRVGRDVAKLYAVPVVLFVGGAGLVFGGHHIMIKRQATLALAYTGLQKAFDAYRGNVRETFGHEADQGMLHGYSVKEVVDPETGETKEIAVRDWDAEHKDPYNRVFCPAETLQWQPDLRVNRQYVENMQKFSQERLNRQGYLYLSDVYESLGFEVNDVSRVVGWRVRDLPDGSREIPAVDFGLNTPMPDDWKYTKEGFIYLDFNCQGLIVGGEIQKILEKA